MWEISAIQTIKIGSESREGGERPLTARVEHISPIGSLFVKLSPPIIHIQIRSPLYFVMITDDEETEWLTSSRPSRARGELPELLAGATTRSRAEVSQPRLEPGLWRHWGRLS